MLGTATESGQQGYACRTPGHPITPWETALVVGVGPFWRETRAAAGKRWYKQVPTMLQRLSTAWGLPLPPPQGVGRVPHAPPAEEETKDTIHSY